MSIPAHVSRVRTLYKAILKLHRGLPLEFQALGDQYVKEEFRRHKKAEPDEVGPFMLEWTHYYGTLAKQLAAKKAQQVYGQTLVVDDLDNMRQEQLGQLYELYKETQKPVDPESPLGPPPNQKS